MILRGIVFIKNTVILTLTSLILRTVGMIFKVWVSARVGAEGVGLYQLITSVYIFAATFASTGICTGVTKLISEQSGLTAAGASQILRKSAVLTVAASAVIGSAVYFSADFIAARLLMDIRASLSLKILCFSLPFKGTAACIKGYFYARRKSGSPAVSQLFEQAVRIGVIVFFVGSFAGMGLNMAVAAILIGDTVSEAASFIYLYISFLRDKKTLPSKGGLPKGVYRGLIGVALPTAGSKYVTSGLHTAESLIVPSQLTLFTFSRSESVAQYGMLKGMALPLLFFPAAFLGAASIMLMPEVAEAAAKGQERKVRETVSKSIDTTLVISIFLAAVFFTNSDLLGRLFFGSEEVGYMIRILAPIVPFMYLESVADGMLKGLGLQNYSFIYNVSDSVIRIALVMILVRRYGMTGFLGVMIISNCTTSTLNVRRLLKSSNTPLNIKNGIIKPLAAAAAGSVAASFAVSGTGIDGWWGLIAAVIIQGASFAAVMLVTGGINGAAVFNAASEAVYLAKKKHSRSRNDRRVCAKAKRSPAGTERSRADKERGGAGADGRKRAG